MGFATQSMHAVVTPRYAYVADPAGGSGEILSYEISPINGALVPLPPCFVTPDAANGPVDVLVDRNGAFLYVANVSTSTIASYPISPTTGCLGAPLFFPTFGIAPVSMALSAHDSVLYVADATTATIDAFSVVGGALAPVAGSPFPTGPCAVPSGIAIDLTQSYLYLADSTGNVCEFTIGPGGVLAAPVPFPIGGAPDKIAVDSVGQFVYVSNTAASAVFSFQIGAGGVLIPTVPAGAPTGHAPTGIAVSPFGQLVFTADNGVAKLSSFTINLPPPAAAYGSLAVNGPAVATGAKPNGVTVDQTGRYLYVANTGGSSISGYNINTVTGKPAPAIAGSPFAGPPGSAPVAIATQP
jgi:6-phosphogluconolactonase (cycloisomerase 2 family)